LHSHRVVNWINIKDSIEPPEVDQNLPRARYGTAAKPSVAALRDYGSLVASAAANDALNLFNRAGKNYCIALSIEFSTSLFEKLGLLRII
jgi:hypothetical protein|tara:strand:+ start:26756 stop:27025 length:270 start_codon:yes stop_codon:yes gene_type:complete